MKKRKRALALCIVGLLILWVFTGGFVFHRYQEIVPNHFNNNFHPLLLVEFDRHVQVFGLPYFCIYFTDEVPFDMEIEYITHNVVEQPELQIDKLLVQYDDGDALDLSSTVVGKV